MRHERKTLLPLPETSSEKTVRPRSEHAGRSQVPVPRVSSSKARRSRGGSATPEALATATVSLCHPLRGSGPRRRGVAIVRHMLPFWRDDAATLEVFVELWVGEDRDDES